jgi:hypothetical protein
MTSYFATRLTRTMKPPRRNISCALSSKPIHRQPCVASRSSSRISTVYRGRLLASRFRRPRLFRSASPGFAGSDFDSVSSRAFSTAASSSFWSCACAASRSPRASCTSHVLLRSVLLPKSRRLSSVFSCARFAIVPSSTAIFDAVPASSACSAATCARAGCVKKSAATGSSAATGFRKPTIDNHAHVRRAL